MAEPALNIGQDPGLRFALAWTAAANGETAADATRGWLGLWLGGTLIWGSEPAGEPSGFEWVWVELLEHLADAWPYLEWEEGDPLGLGEPPDALRHAAERRWRRMPDESSEDEARQLAEFERTHDLASALGGAWLPSVYLARTGTECWLAGGGQRVRRPAAEVFAALTGLGDAIRDRLAMTRDPRGVDACQAWADRRRVSPVLFATVTTGLPEATLRAVAGRSEIDRFWEADPERAGHEILAAARMLGPGAAVPDLRGVIARVRRAPRRQTPELDAIAARALTQARGERPYQQGVAVARWLRTEVARLQPDDRAMPEDMLAGWGVAVDPLVVRDSRIDAVAAWGAHHGPVVLFNPQGKHAKGNRGLRFTLAHELAHLLLDRGQALPAAEVLGGRAPREPEARANAFAAELLAPCDRIGTAFVRAADPADELRALCRQYDVAREVIAWQAYNSGRAIPRQTLAFLRTLVSQPERFEVE